MLDIARLRHAFFHPPPDGERRLPTREEHIARRERRALDACHHDGSDPRAFAIGEHGSLIGGPDKPLSFSNLDCPPEYRAGRVPLPLSWFTHPSARTPPPGGPPEDHPVLDALIGDHLAGYPDRPTALDLARILRSAAPTERERSILYHILGCIRPWDLTRLLSRERLSVYELARAIHFSGIRRPQVVDWLHMFAARPSAQ
ncbi:MAG: hypothetical protein OYL41_05415 [Acidobacteriota bacterium]|nr:hypothetical protein [Acidobacteriota bacterium]